MTENWDGLALPLCVSVEYLLDYGQTPLSLPFFLPLSPNVFLGQCLTFFCLFSSISLLHFNMEESEKVDCLSIPVLSIYSHRKCMAPVFITLFVSRILWPEWNIFSSSQVLMFLDISDNFAKHKDDSLVYSFLPCWNPLATGHAQGYQWHGELHISVFKIMAAYRNTPQMSIIDKWIEKQISLVT